MKEKALTSGLEKELYEYLRSLTVIDAHEHFKPERDHLSKTPDFAWLLQYVVGDLRSAGLRGLDIYDDSLTPEEKWKLVGPHWNAVKHGSYARAVRLTLQDLIGEDDITDGNFQRIGAALKENNKPGLYRKFFIEKYGFERLIVSNGTRAVEPYPYTKQDYEVMRLIIGLISPRSFGELEYYEKATGMELRTPAALKKGLARFVDDQVKDEGVVGFKLMSQPVRGADAREAERALSKLVKREELDEGEQAALNGFWYDEALGLVRETGLPAAVHCGVWGDFRKADVTNFIPLIQRFGDVRFDLFHMSMPSTRAAAFVCKNFPNAHANLCWSPIVSQMMFEASLAEWLDLVPANKIAGFGGDIIYCPEAVLGCLVICMESLAGVFARRVESGRMVLADAKTILKGWLYDNPKRMYGI